MKTKIFFALIVIAVLVVIIVAGGLGDGSDTINGVPRDDMRGTPMEGIRVTPGSIAPRNGNESCCNL